MSNVAFLWIFSRGVELGVIVLCLLPLRALLRKKVPRLFSYVLWAALPVNLLYNLVIKLVSQKDPIILDCVNKLPQIMVDERTVQGMQQFWKIGTIFVVAAMVAWYLYLLRCLVGSIRMEKGIYVTDRIDTPFTLGLLCPKIYLPSSLKETYRESVILHERVHISRKDVWMKYLAVGILGLFWFQPVLWFAYRLFINDMEAACDETVLRRKGPEFRKEYARSLVEVSFQENKVHGVALGYGSGEIKERIENVINYKPLRARWRIVALVLCLLFMFVAIPLSWQVPRMVQVNRGKYLDVGTSAQGRGMTKQKIISEETKD